MEHFDIYRKLGNAFELLAYSELHKDYSVEYLYREIYLPASLKQMYVYYDEDELPVGFITWASINSIVEGNIENNYTGLSIKEWNCGERLFINDLVCPWGGSRFIVNDIKNRLFPLVKYGLGLRRKKIAHLDWLVFLPIKLMLVLYKSFSLKLEISYNIILISNLIKFYRK